MYNIAWFVTFVLIQFGLTFTLTDFQLPTCSSYNCANVETYPCKTEGGYCYPYQWLSTITKEYDKTNRRLTVKFTHAPPETKFENYTVKLEGDNYFKSELTNKKEVHFPNVCNGEYNISVKPKDPAPSVKGKCLCYKSERRCIVCKRTTLKIHIMEENNSKCNTTNQPSVMNTTNRQSVMNTTNQPSVMTTTTVFIDEKKPPPVKNNTTTIKDNNSSSKTHSNQTEGTKSNSTHSSHIRSPPTQLVVSESKYKNTLWVALGSSVAILLALSFIWFMCSTTRDNLTDKKILFLYSHDHQHHFDVGKAMATYMQHFKCQVLYPPLFAEEEIKQWLHKTVADCDFVLLLHSECIKRQSEPWANGLEYPQLRDNRNENVLMSILTMIRECPLLQLYHSKYISCRLEHLSESYVLNEFPSVQNFVLTRDLKKLIYYIHRIPPNSVLKSLALRSSDSSASSMALQQAAQKTAEFEKNKMWFTQKYSYLVPRCGILNDKCDCRSALNEEFDGTVDIPKLPLNSFPDLNFDDSMSKRGYYFNDIHSFSEMSQVSSELAMLNDRNDQQYKNRYSLLPSLSEGVTDCVSNWTDVTYASSRGSNPVCV